jgi:hypothetical protein
VNRSLLVLCLLLPALALPAVAQPSRETAQKVLARPHDQPARSSRPARLPLAFIKGERIAFLGNSQAERMNLFGHFETLLHTRFPNQELVVRNFARPAEEVGIQQRSADYTVLDDPQTAFGADTYFCFFGFNESYAGPDGIEAFRKKYNEYLDSIAKRYPRDDTGAAPRFILVSPIAFEATGDPLLPDAAPINQNLRLYSAAADAVAAERKIAFVDLFEATDKLLAAEPGMQLTINGCHLNEAGDREVARIMDQLMFGSASPASFGSEPYEALRAAVNDKSWVHQQDYRMLNGWYVYGGRRTWDTETFPLEYLKIRKMAEVRDRRIWDMAQGKPVPQTIDDAATGELFTPQLVSANPARSIPKLANCDTSAPRI